MFESTPPGPMQGTVHVTALAQVAREARWSLDAPRSYLVPSLFWITAGQGRIRIDDALRGFTACNALFIPANTPHAIEIATRCQGSAVFFNAAAGLSCPDRLVHLRLHGLGRQSELAHMIDALAVEAKRGAADTDTVLFHQAALLMLWLRRHEAGSVRTLVTLPAPEARSEAGTEAATEAKAGTRTQPADAPPTHAPASGPKPGRNPGPAPAPIAPNGDLRRMRDGKRGS